MCLGLGGGGLGDRTSGVSGHKERVESKVSKFEIIEGSKLDAYAEHSALLLSDFTLILTAFLYHQVHPGLLYTHGVHHNTLVQSTVGSAQVCY